MAASAAGNTTVDIVVPSGAAPGTLLQARLPNGVVIQAPVPAGKKPGDSFTAQVDRAQMRAAQEATNAGTGSPSSQAKNVQLLMYTFIFVMVIIGIGFLWQALQRESSTLAQFIEGQLHLHVLFLLVVLGAFIHDWSYFGPTVALQHCAVAGFFSILAVVVVTTFLPDLSMLVLLTLGILAMVLLTFILGPFGMIIGLIFLIAAVVWGGAVTSIAGDLLSTGDLGSCLVFLLSFGLFRYAMSLAPGVSGAGSWPHTTALAKDSQEFKQQRDSFLEACATWSHKYDFKLQVLRIYKVNRPEDQTAPPLFPGTGAVQLFHGTSWEAGKAIVCDGYRLPAHAGMFGKGIYFADCPLKSWRYCFPTKQLSKTLPSATGRGGCIIMSWVELGKIREERSARTDLDGSRKRGWRGWFSGDRHAYDSVRGVETEAGGSVRVPEYVIYNPKQARVAYIFEVKSVPVTRGAE